MAPIVSTIEIARPPDEVFAYVANPLRFAEWQEGIVRVDLADGGPLSVGSRFTPVRQIGGVERAVTMQVTEYNPGKGWAVRGIDGPVRPSVKVDIEPLDGGTRSRVTFAIDIEGRGIGVPIAALARRQAQKVALANSENLKKRIESSDGRTTG